MPQVGKTYEITTKYGKTYATVNWIKENIVNCDLFFCYFNDNFDNAQIDIKCFNKAKVVR